MWAGMELPLPFGLSLSGHCVAGRTAADLGQGVAVVARQVLSEVVLEGILASGGQIAAMCDGELVADVAVGETGWGEKLTPHHTSPCSGGS